MKFAYWNAEFDEDDEEREEFDAANTEDALNKAIWLEIDAACTETEYSFDITLRNEQGNTRTWAIGVEKTLSITCEEITDKDACVE